MLLSTIKKADVLRVGMLRVSADFDETVDRIPTCMSARQPDATTKVLRFTLVTW